MTSNFQDQKSHQIRKSQNNLTHRFSAEFLSLKKGKGKGGQNKNKTNL